MYKGKEAELWKGKKGLDWKNQTNVRFTANKRGKCTKNSVTAYIKV